MSDARLGWTLAAALRPVLDFALPPRCPGCGAITAEPHRFCLDCWSRLTFLGEPCCAVCALPFEFAAPSRALCGACLAEPPAFDRMRAAVAYGEIPRAVALKLKYGGRPGVAETMARLVERHLSGPDAKPADGKANTKAPILVPVPLHRWRIWKRGYNQAALIAVALARRNGLDTCLDLLERKRATPPLRAMGPKQRRATVRGAFRVADRHRERLRGRPVILVDDVFTSGATADACARTLKRAGAARVELLCWARVVRALDDAGQSENARAERLDSAGTSVDKDRRHAHFTRDMNVAKVEIYTKAFCGYCARAKRLLQSKGVNFEEYDITLGGPKRAEMLQRAHGRSTVPQIFIDGRHVGGSNDLQELEHNGRLDPLLSSG